MFYVIARKDKDGGVTISHPSTEWNRPARFFCRFAPDHSGKPDYRHKYVTLNCYKYNIMWDKRA